MVSAVAGAAVACPNVGGTGRTAGDSVGVDVGVGGVALTDGAGVSAGAGAVYFSPAQAAVPTTPAAATPTTDSMV